MGKQLVTGPQLKRALAKRPSGSVTLRELRPETDYTLSYGLAQLPLPNANKRIELSAYQWISLTDGTSQSFQISAYLQTSYRLSDFAHINPMSMSISGGYIDSTATVVDSSNITGSVEEGLRITATLLVKTYNDQRARLEIECNIDLENGCTVNLTVTPLDGDYYEYLYGLSFGVDAYTEPRDVYALTLDFLQPFGSLDSFEATATINAPAYNLYAVTQIVAKRYLPMAMTFESNGNSSSLPTVWEGDRLRLIIDDSAYYGSGYYGSGSGINSEVYDLLFQYLQISKLVKSEVTS